MTDNAIMLKVKDGDLGKMSLLYARHSRALYSFLFHATHQREACEDMVQNVFYRMIKYRHTFTGNGEFITWMYHVARNVLKDHIKKQPAPGNHKSLDELAELMGGGEMPDIQIEKRQAVLELYKAMGMLKDENREILSLSRFRELKHQEIAGILNITEGAVKVRIYRAMQELRNIYIKMNIKP